MTAGCGFQIEGSFRQQEVAERLQQSRVLLRALDYRCSVIIIAELVVLSLGEKLPLSPTAVREVLQADGFAALPRRLVRNGPSARAPRIGILPLFP